MNDIVYQLATDITTAASGSAAMSETHTRKTIQGLRQELQQKFDEDRVIEVTHRGQLKHRLGELELGNCRE